MRRCKFEVKSLHVATVEMLFLLFQIIGGGEMLAQKQQETGRLMEAERVKWFEDARLGMMIHWSLCSPAAGRFHGERLRNSYYAEWIRSHNRVQKADWDEMVKRMPITEKEVEDWVLAAKEGGFKYLTFVTKHHDGVAFWNSKVSDYTYGKLSGTNFDVLKCLKKYCDKYNIILCAYYSHWLDWGDPNGRNNTFDYADEQKPGFDRIAAGRGEVKASYRSRSVNEDYEKYWYGKAMPQVAELIKDYGVKLFWFDCWRTDPVGQGEMTEKQMRDMLQMIRELDPEVLVNTRLGIHDVGENGVDFETMGDNQFPEKPLGHMWETAATFNLTWGYNRDDQNWRSTTYFVREIVKGIYKGGNVMLNVGPRADGSIPAEIKTRIQEIGQVIKRNKVGYYHTYPSPFREASQDWGLITQARDGANTKLYLHVFEWPSDGIIRVNGLKNKVLKAVIPALGKQYQIVQKGLMLHINAPLREPVDYDTVIELTVQGKQVEVEHDLCGEINFGGIHMDIQNARLMNVGRLRSDEVDSLAHRNGENKNKGMYVPVSIHGWKHEEAKALWRVYIPEAGEHELLINYACDEACAGQRYVVEVENGDSIQALTVANPGGYKDFYTRHLGKIKFSAPGIYTLVVRPVDKVVSNELFGLNWLFLK